MNFNCKNAVFAHFKFNVIKKSCLYEYFRLRNLHFRSRDMFLSKIPENISCNFKNPTKKKKNEFL